MELLTAAEMRAIERAAIESGVATGRELMERAGRGVVAAILDWRPALARAPGRAAVLCGPGNNGGDGFVIARHLKMRGWAVDVFLLGAPANLPPDAAENCSLWREMGAIRPLTEAADGRRSVHDLVIDALFGTGLTRPLEGAARVCAARSWRRFGGAGAVVAVDVPSGMCADSGRALQAEPSDEAAATKCDLTVTFHHERLGHRLAQGPSQLCGDVRVVDIGLAGVPAAAARLGAPNRPGLSKTIGHKYSHGHALILSGGVGRGGAARLAARGALRVGAGLVTLAAPPAAIIENASRLDAIMLRSVKGIEGISELLVDRRINVVALGPGLGVGENTCAKVGAALANEERGAVLDADALSSYQDEPETLFRLTRGRSVVLTPHMGEFGRLFPAVAEKLVAPAARGPAFSKLDAARAAAALAGCIILLKGPDTVVAAPDGEAVVVSAHYERACPWLATAGAGDVLAGMIAGLIARGFHPFRAAESAAWLHQEAARGFGPGLIAEDIPERLPAVFRDLGL
ncbi:NAD(P)H-hydrate dehydratase [Pikeienuella piscinae]|uniref:Bifunctional NAD(P)H-hydrate repair enzyme n=1 Tax=Pikeienuella piscinae TaxID=2748098 RepID=A0A7L5BWF7_9RHOB|nr:NAD(P)H-hydrate dehydratase [Pikeienuella piscinae]QIE54877.1 NAD(P)H-hydrate dehydratase [Pikeienuella piscinae]